MSDKRDFQSLLDAAISNTTDIKVVSVLRAMEKNFEPTEELAERINALNVIADKIEDAKERLKGLKERHSTILDDIATIHRRIRSGGDLFDLAQKEEEFAREKDQMQAILVAYIFGETKQHNDAKESVSLVQAEAALSFIERFKSLGHFSTFRAENIQMHVATLKEQAKAALKAQEEATAPPSNKAA